MSWSSGFSFFAYILAKKNEIDVEIWFGIDSFLMFFDFFKSVQYKYKIFSISPTSQLT